MQFFNVSKKLHFVIGDISGCHSYPYEALRVITEDGHILLLERIPRYVEETMSCSVHHIIIVYFR